MTGDNDGRYQKPSRWGRFVKMGSLAASVTTNVVGKQLTNAFASKEKRDAMVREGLIENAQKVVKTMGEMKGAAMKLGQMLSVAPDLLPKEVRDELGALHRDAPPMPYEAVAEAIEAGLGTPITELFSYFDPEPLGSASIGQVHRAKTFDGREVAIKIQYPGILDTLDADIKNLGSLMALGKVVADKATIDAELAELKEGLLDEADYEKEADNLEKYGPLLNGLEGIRVPQVHRDLSGPGVLGMEFLNGRKLDEAVESLPQAERNLIGVRFSKLYIWMFHEAHFLQADPHPGNFLYLEDGSIGLLDFGCIRTYEAEFCDAWLSLLALFWTGRTHQLRTACDEMGFTHKQGQQGPSNEKLVELCEIFLAPFLTNADFNWGAWKPKDALTKWATQNFNSIGYAAPPKSAFYFRVAAGVWGALQKWDIEANYYQIAQEMATQRGLLDSSQEK